MVKLDPAFDGVTHINVYSKGKTQLGRMLSNFYPAPFVVPDHGRFTSVEGYWYWLSCKDDSLRSAWGFRAKELGRELKAADWPSTPDFEERIKVALACKILQNPQIKTEFSKCRLPLAHYYVYGGKVVPVPKGDWILRALEQIQSQLA